MEIKALSKRDIRKILDAVLAAKYQLTRLRLFTQDPYENDVNHTIEGLHLAVKLLEEAK